MSSAFERLQKIAQQKKDSEKEKPNLELVSSIPTNPANNFQDEFVEIPNQPNIDNQPNQPNIDNQPNQNISQVDFEVKKPTKLKARKTLSPERDFTKVPNSVTRDIVPERLFKGMSKNTYDALYLRTRGAINPIREIRATKSDLLRWTGVSDVTLDKHLKHLRSVGLVNWKFIIGSHDGNLYEVFVPEELDLTNLTNLTNLDIPNVPKKVGGEVPNFLGYVGGVQNYEDKELNQPLKTSLKTNTYDDENTAVFSGFVNKFEKAAEKLTGKKLDPREASKWETLADLLILELEIAAKRSNGISSIPAFLTEVLRRQLFTARHAKSDKEKHNKKNFNVAPDTIGKPPSESFEVKSLSTEQREIELQQMQEFAEADFLNDFKKWYTDEDWEWILTNLSKNKKA